MTTRDHLAADLAHCLADTEDGAVPILWDGQEYTGIVNRQALGGLENCDATGSEICRVVTSAAGFPRPFPGGHHNLDGETWQITAVGETLGSLTIDLERHQA